MTASLEIEESPNELVRVHAPQGFLRGFIPAMRDVWGYRELLLNLVKKELKVKYKNSTLGFMWSLLRPMFLLFVYWLVFGLIMGSQVPSFAIYLFSGLIAWELFSNTINACTQSITGNAGLIKKVYFPREVLPLASAGANLVHFCFQLIVLFGVLVGVLMVTGKSFLGPRLVLLPLALVCLVILASGVGLLLAAANVYFRDVQHLIELILVFGFWTTPVVYPIQFVTGRLAGDTAWLAKLYLLNPLANLVMTFQAAVYNPWAPEVCEKIDGRCRMVRLQVLRYPGLADYLLPLVGVLLFACFMFWLGQRVFARSEGNFAQEL